jgi:hypothetical protein
VKLSFLFNSENSVIHSYLYNIEGLKLPGSPEQCKIVVFSDDSTGILTTDKSINKFLYLINLFGRLASGSKLNKNQTKGLWLGAWKDRKDN